MRPVWACFGGTFMKSALTNTFIAILFIVAFGACSKSKPGMSGKSASAGSLIGDSGGDSTTQSDDAKIGQVNSEAVLKQLLDSNNIDLKDALLALQRQIDQLRTDLNNFKTDTTNKIAALTATTKNLQAQITANAAAAKADLAKVNNDLLNQLNSGLTSVRSDMDQMKTAIMNSMSAAISASNAATDQKISDATKDYIARIQTALGTANAFTTEQIAQIAATLRTENADAQAATLKTVADQIGASENKTAAQIQAAKQAATDALNKAVSDIKVTTDAQAAQLNTLGSNLSDLAARVVSVETAQQVMQSAATSQASLATINADATLLQFVNDARNADYSVNASGFINQKTGAANPATDQSLADYETAAKAVLNSTSYTFAAGFKSSLIALYGTLQSKTDVNALISEWSTVITDKNSKVIQAQTDSNLDFEHRVVKMFETVSDMQGNYVNYQNRIDVLLNGATPPAAYTNVISQYSGYGSKLQKVLSDFSNLLQGNKNMITQRDDMINAMNTRIDNLSADVQAQFTALTNSFNDQIGNLRKDMNAGINNLQQTLNAHDLRLNQLANGIADLTAKQANFAACANSTEVRSRVTDLMQAMNEMELAFFAALDPVTRARAAVAANSQAPYGGEDAYGIELRNQMKSIPTANTDCKYDDSRTFANSMGQDGFAYLARAYTSVAMTGDPNYSINDATLESARNTALAAFPTAVAQSLFGQVVTRILVQTPSGAIPDCKLKTDNWVKNVFKTQALQTLGDGTKFWDAIKNNSNFQAKKNSVLTIMASVKQLMEDHKDALACNSQPNATPQVIADSIVNAVINQAQLDDRKSTLDSTVSNAAALARATLDNAKNAAADQATKDQITNQINNLNTSITNNVTNINNSLNQINNTVIQNVQNSSAALAGKVDNLMRAVAEIASRAGYTDITNWVYANVACQGNATNTCVDMTSPALAPAAAPRIDKVQHFFGAFLYQQDTGTYGVAVPANVPDWNLCTGAAVNINFTTGSGVGGPCWLNFRDAPMQNAVYNNPTSLTFRVFGAADAIQARNTSSGMSYFRNVSIPSPIDATVNGFPARAQQRTTDLKNWIGGTLESNGDVSNVTYRTGDRKGGGTIDFTMENVARYSVNGSMGNYTYTFTPWRTVDNAGTAFQKGNDVNYTIYMYSPLVLDIHSSGPLRTVSSSKGVSFDLDASGKNSVTGWVDGYHGAFLALDLDNSGKITSGSQLFGQATKLANGKTAENGFLALAQYDTEHRGVIDEKNPIFGKLRLWFDYNADGISQPGELKTLKEAGVTEISLNYSEVKDYYSVDSGNLLKYQATAKGPKTCPAGVCKVYDVYFGATKQLVTR